MVMVECKDQQPRDAAAKPGHGLTPLLQTGRKTEKVARARGWMIKTVFDFHIRSARFLSAACGIDDLRNFIDVH